MYAIYWHICISAFFNWSVYILSLHAAISLLESTRRRCFVHIQESSGGIYWHRLHGIDSLSTNTDNLIRGLIQTLKPSKSCVRSGEYVCNTWGSRTSLRPIIPVQVINMNVYVERKEKQLDATQWFIELIIRSTCFGHYYTHLQELETVHVVTVCGTRHFVSE